MEAPDASQRCIGLVAREPTLKGKTDAHHTFLQIPEQGRK
jgi:hypothetical protein